LSDRTALVELLTNSESLGILHHWDADGISSAASVIEWATDGGRRVESTCPAIGDFDNLDEGIRRLAYEGPDLILVLDLSATRETMNRVAGSSGGIHIAWVDHHSLPPSSPAGIDFFHPENSGVTGVYSNSRFLEQLSGREPGIIGAIGNCGDLGRRIMVHPARVCTEIAAGKSGLEIGQLLEIVSLIDSNYRSGRREDVLNAPWVLSKEIRDPRTLLQFAPWVENRNSVDRELSRLMELPVERKRGILLKDIETPMHLTSKIARETSIRADEGNQAVVVRNRGRDPSPVYVRRIDPGINLIELIHEARSMGLSAGGKPEVVGMLVSREKLDQVTGMIMKILKGGT
jgi:hypothetical protein